MNPFLDEDFRLGNDAAKALYHDAASKLPLFDYHTHLCAKDMLEDAPFTDPASLFLINDHYKWRLMRANGTPERFVTGGAPGYEKFCAFARTLPYAAGNPIYVWTHLELKRYFEIDVPLCADNADAIWRALEAQLRSGGCTPRALIARSNVHTLVTTDDPAEDLAYHAELAKDASFQTRVLPGFRPERAGEIWRGGEWKAYLETLGEAAGTEITSFSALTDALDKRMDDFMEHGCVLGDYSLGKMPFRRASEDELSRVFKRALSGFEVTCEEAEAYLTELLLWLAARFCERGWALLLRVGPLRAQNAAMSAKIGRDAGFDAMGDHAAVENIGRFLDALCSAGKLPKTMLFNLNPRDSAAFAAMAATYQDESFPSKIQLGPAWWMNDHFDGIRAQLITLAAQGLLGRFAGMASDGRSYLSFARHEYFRRVLCSLVGEWTEAGEYPQDEGMLEQLVRGICFDNARAYFHVG